ncbi:MAG: RNA-guided endonuclease TnpB family protein [Clostridium sp.]|uniref:RNA-guided endonuclease InsQ/TnpB family protein n=1 Tax=Clostridium sp. TaxID=1506 RepID=UPI0025C3E0F8|nr:transposase [Clostridium sp.]MCE5220300.1 RNA-guided endonuclease TnpB family protein [Clostridium sp.]
MSSKYNFKEKGIKQLMKNTTGSSGVGNLAYKILVEEGKENNCLYSSNASQSIKLAGDKWEEFAPYIEKGEKSIPSYRNNIPLEVASNTIELRYDDKFKKYYFNIKLLKPEYKEELSLESTSILFKIRKIDRARENILYNLNNRIYKLCGSKLQKQKGKYMLLLTYNLEVQQRNLKAENILGIDMGVVNAAVVAVNNSYNRYFIGGSEIAEYKARIESRKKDIQRQSKFCGDGRRGHGYKAKMKPLEHIRNRESNFNATTNHKYAKAIVNWALKHECATIQVEDLSGIKGDKTEKFLKAWTYYDLQNKIEQKVKKYGIVVRKINPKFTSQRCSRCGYIHKDNRKIQAEFHCLNCDLKINADYNAALNIATDNIEDIIRIQDKIQSLYKENYLTKFPMKQCDNLPLITEVKNYFKLHYDKKVAKNKGKSVEKIIEKIEKCEEKMKSLL